MRLDATQKALLSRLIRQRLGEDAKIFVFGSRLDDARTGGDVDLLVESGRVVTRQEHAALVVDVEEALGLPVDIVFRVAGQPASAFQRMIRADAVKLEDA